MPVVVQARPCCAPESHVPASPTLAPLQRGQTCVEPVRKTRDCRFTVPLATPVAMSALKPVILGLPKLFTTQTGMFAASSGRGAPNVAPLTTPVWLSSSEHCGFDVAPHPVRHTRSSELETTGKFWLVPVHPLSRSVPELAADSRSSRGPPAGLALQLPPPVLGRHCTLMTSLSFLGFVLATAIAVSVTFADGISFPFLFTLSGRRMMLSAEQVGLLIGVGGGVGGVTGSLSEPTLMVFGWALTVTLSMVSGGCFGHPGTFVCATQTPTPSTQRPFWVPSTSQDGSPSWQARFLPLLGVMPDHST